MDRTRRLREIWKKSAGLAALSAVLTLPYFHYLVYIAPRKAPLPSIPHPGAFLSAQLLLLFIICFLSAMTGFLFSRRAGLPGFGDPSVFFRDLPVLAVLGILMTMTSYILFDRHFLAVSPVSYPRASVYLLSFPLKGAFTDEIILRFCLVTVAVGLLKRKIAGVLSVSLFGALLTSKYFFYIGLDMGGGGLFFTQLLLSFGANLVLGLAYVYRGLFHAMLLKFIFGLKYILVLWFSGSGLNP